MIVKMKFLNITGPKDDIDRVTEKYLSKYEIQLEQAMSELKTTENLKPFSELNPYKELLAKADEFADYLSEKGRQVEPDQSLSLEEMKSFIRDLNHDYAELVEKQDQLKKKREEVRNRLMMAEPFKPFDFDLHTVMQYQFIRFRFGRVPIETYHRFEKYVFDNIGALFVEGGRDEKYVYGVYFAAHSEAKNIDPIFASLHFERLYLPDEYSGTPMQACRRLEEELAALSEEIQACSEEIGQLFLERAGKILGIKAHLEEMSRNYDVRKMAAQVEDKHETFYLLCGWMPETDAEAFMNEVKDDDKVFVVAEEDRTGYFKEPPTKLKNPKFFKPFEMFINMYGLPAHGEIDPTIFMALTYTFIFGAMFGDVGQGLCLFIGGALLYKFKKMNLAGIISIAGIFSTFFGFMFGSFFGFENVIEPKWISPLEHMTELPFVGRLNTVFVVAIIFGMAIIVICMVLHIINGLRAHDTGAALFDSNGVAGLVFYLAAVGTVILFMTGQKLPATVVLVVMFIVPLLLIALKEPLMKKLEKSTEKMEESKAMFAVQAFFELFETLLSYFSNTLSFVRIGAFAVSHAAMMQVVLMLAGAENGSPNWIVIVLGNLFVCLMEGLVVGIQVLRLEYYEIFSRFYKGSGRQFKPYTKANQ
ncbi:MAG TPA: ATPase [Lachnospiraceae bacterium]|nr:ATPase [Lachnospiraceae bacterium]